jgi:flagellar protein FliT
MSVAQVIANYETLATLTSQMHETARRGEWELLIDCEQQRSALIAAMKPLDAETRLDESTRHRKNELITRVLAHDAEIRNLVQAWMDECDLSMRSSAQELRLLREYGR